MDSDDASAAEPKRRASKKAVPTPEPVAAPSRKQPEPLEIPEKVTPTTEERRLPSTPTEDHPSRPDAPTPRRSANQHGSQEISPDSTPQPQRVKPAETSPPIPEITLQGATPARPVPADRRASSTTSSSTRSHDSIIQAPLTPIQAPQVGDEAMQSFFKQIADQINAMSLRQSMMVGGSPDLQALAMAALTFATNPDGFRSAVTAAPPPPTPLDGEFPFDGRYDDAPEEVQYHEDGAHGLGIANYQDIQAARGPVRPPIRNSGGQYQHQPGRRIPSPIIAPTPPSRMRSSSNGSEVSDKENDPRVHHRASTYDQPPPGRPRANSHHVQRPPTNQDGLRPRSSIRSDSTLR